MIIQDDPTHETKATELPEWAKWKGLKPAPYKWIAINPKTKQATIVYRSYEDYCND